MGANKRDRDCPIIDATRADLKRWRQDDKALPPHQRSIIRSVTEEEWRRELRGEEVGPISPEDD